MNRKTFYIPYNGEDTRVDVEDTNGKRTFLVYVTGEDGHLNISIKTDENGNENWYEGEQLTPRAKEIGELIELETM
ncbi:hypothetical protein [Chitinophaga filiformis]|uniref:Uncharacterized protein n=1 Tax=Chitinophaga filiformis TaxID=104663 RepID=A0A1G7S5F6_CHIFI|nr:hypothetical protein [Chitinophaga filiformis]SDG17410.1 hypothetical protein SAMN04488121_103717 [Chitinophaga filiformis]